MNDHDAPPNPQNFARKDLDDNNLWMVAIVESSEDAIISKDFERHYY
jgi:hypothetical protein